MHLSTLITGDEIHRYQKSIVINFTGKRKTLSTAPLNGGMQHGLAAVFNHDISVGAGMPAMLRAATYEEHMALVASELGLDAAKAAGISTAAQMENVSIKAQSYKSITVTAVVTGGVETNGGRVGDPAPWDELEQKSIPEPGTINIMLFINTNLTDGALARSLVTCTEAKTAALQELAAPSRYSMGLATGSGTDGTIIVCNSESEILLDDAGKHCKLGECIGRSVKAAVTEALALQTGLSAASQHDALKRVSRFGITAESIWQELGFSEPSGIYKAKYSQVLERLFAKPILVTSCSLYAHLLDEAVWGLISEEDAHISGKCLIGHMGVDEVSSSGGKHSSIALMTSELQKALCELVRRELDSIPL